MGDHLIMKKFVIIILGNIFFDVFLLSLGGYFLMLTFLMGIVNLLLLTFLKKQNRQQTALLSLMLALLLTAIPILFAYLFGDAGAVAFMIVFTFFFVTIPLLLFSILTFLGNKREISKTQGTVLCLDKSASTEMECLSPQPG